MLLRFRFIKTSKFRDYMEGLNLKKKKKKNYISSAHKQFNQLAAYRTYLTEHRDVTLL